MAPSQGNSTSTAFSLYLSGTAASYTDSFIVPTFTEAEILAPSGSTLAPTYYEVY